MTCWMILVPLLTENGTFPTLPLDIVWLFATLIFRPANLLLNSENQSLLIDIWDVAPESRNHSIVLVSVSISVFFFCRFTIQLEFFCPFFHICNIWGSRNSSLSIMLNQSHLDSSSHSSLVSSSSLMIFWSDFSIAITIRLYSSGNPLRRITPVNSSFSLASMRIIFGIIVIHIPPYLRNLS